MAPCVVAPDASALLPPLLACLPTAFVSSRPPPALLPLLSPILRQRVQINTSAGDGQPADTNWLPLLCWKSGEAQELMRMVEDASFEPHPVSGEIELGDVGIPLYRRQDEETLQALLKLPDLGLQALYVWCEHDQQGGDSPGWRLSELRLLTLDLPNAWCPSVLKANQAHQDQAAADPLAAAGLPSLVRSAGSGQHSSAAEEEDEDDDDDYWARYDGSSVRATPAPPAKPRQASHVRTLSEDDYFSRYAGFEQTIDGEGENQTTELGGPTGMLMRDLREKMFAQDEPTPVQPDDEVPRREFMAASESVVHTRPSSSSSAPNVSQLEESAENQQNQAERAVQQHIGHTVKSLYRLSKPTGLSRAEFQRLVQTELELLEVWDNDD